MTTASQILGFTLLHLCPLWAGYGSSMALSASLSRLVRPMISYLEASFLTKEACRGMHTRHRLAGFGQVGYTSADGGVRRRAD